MTSRLRGARDEGFTVAEALVALLLFTVLAAAVGGTVAHAVGLTRATEEQVTATGLAAEHVERARSALPKDLVDAGTAVTDVTVGGVPYRVTRSIATVDQPGVTAAGCDAGDPRSVALRVQIEVTWPGRPARMSPVRSSTVRTVDVAEAFPNTGILYVLVKDFAGAPAAGVTVTLTPGGLPAGVTNNDGCAPFLDIPPRADYTATLSKSGWVDPSNNPSPSRSYLVVRPAATSSTSFVFGPATSLLQPPASLTVTQQSCGAGSSPTFVGATPAYANASGTTSVSMAKPSGIAAGDLMLAHLVVRGDTTAVTPPANWTLVKWQASSFAGIAGGVWQRRATSDMPNSYTWTFPSTGVVGGIVAYRNVHRTAPVNAAESQADNTGGPTTEAPSVTTTSANTTLVAFWGGNSAGSYAVPASMTKRHEASSSWGSVRSAIAGQQLATAGATGIRTATGNAGLKGIGHSVALAPQRLANVTATWPETISTAAVGYRLQRLQAGVLQRTQNISGKSTTNATDSGLVSGVNYTFDIASTTSSGSVSPVLTRFFTPLC